VLENRVLRRIFGLSSDEVTGGSGENYITRSLMICTPVPQYCPGDKIENIEMGGACSAKGGEERHILGFGGET
jgi:hypothetical protein